MPPKVPVKKAVTAKKNPTNVAPAKKPVVNSKPSVSKTSLSKKPVQTTPDRPSSSSKRSLTKEDLAAIKIQKIVRGFLARKRKDRLRKEKADYENEMDRLEKEAFVYLVKLQRAEAERKQKLEDEERRKILEHNKRKKRILEACFDGEKALVQKILREISELDDKSGLGHDVIGKAIRNRHLLEIINCTDPNKNTPILEAAGGGHADLVKFLIDQGAEINSRGQFMRTALYRAAFSGHVQAVQVLLEHGADPRLYDESAQTPIDVAANDSTKEVLQQWNLEDTEKMLKQIDHFRKKRVEEETKRHHAEMEQLEGRLAKEEKEMATVKLRLNKAYEEREKRIREHDLAVAEGYARTDVTENMIHDAEFDLESAKMAFKNATEKVSLTKLALREKKLEEKKLTSDKDKGNAEEGDEADEGESIHCQVKELDDVLFRDVGNKMKNSGRWPLVIDKGDLASTFLRYRDTNFINALSPVNVDSNRIRLALLGALRYGKPLVLDMMEMDLFDACTQRFDAILPNLMQIIVDKRILKPENYLRLVRESDGKEYEKNNFIDHRVQQFTFILLSQNPFPSKMLLSLFLPVWVEVK